MASRPLEHLVLFSVVATEDGEEGEEGLIVQLAWEVISISKNQVLIKEQVHVCPGGGTPANLPHWITPEAIKAAGHLDCVLKQFHSMLTKLGGSTFSLVTFGPMALRGLIHPQAYKICLPLQKYLHRYLDIIKEFCRSFPSTPAPTTVEEMAKLVDIPVEGTAQPGLQQLEVVGKVAQKLISRGHVFSGQEVIRDVRDDVLDASLNPSLVKEGCVVRLRGLPYQASLKDVAGFLSGLNYIPGGIVFGINSIGKRTGEAIAVLENAEQVQLALGRHKRYLNQRYVEVYDATPEDFNKMAGVRTGGGGGGGEDSEGSRGGAPSNIYVARIQGLPYRVTEQDIVKFFQPSANVKHDKDGVFIVHYSDGKATGDGFALFENEQDLTQSLHQLNKSMLGNRYIELFKSSLKEFEIVLSRSGLREEKEHFGQLLGLEITTEELELGGHERNCVKLRGIPYSATPDDVVKFFGDLNEDIEVHGIHMVLSSVNRPTGECYVQMKSVDAASEASETLHKKYMERRYIEVFQCSGDEVARGIQDHGARGGQRFGGGGGGRKRRSVDDTVIKVRGLPYSAKEYEVKDFFHDFSISENDVELVYNNSGRPTGMAYVTFPSKSDAQQAVRERNGKHLGNRYLELYLMN